MREPEAQYWAMLRRNIALFPSHEPSDTTGEKIMTTATVSDQSFGRGKPKSSFLQRVISQVSLWQERAQARAALARMSEHQLKDIGLTHADAFREVHKAPWSV